MIPQHLGVFNRAFSTHLYPVLTQFDPPCAKTYHTGLRAGSFSPRTGPSKPLRRRACGVTEGRCAPSLKTSHAWKVSTRSSSTTCKRSKRSRRSNAWPAQAPHMPCAAPRVHWGGRPAQVSEIPATGSARKKINLAKPAYGAWLDPGMDVLARRYGQGKGGRSQPSP